MTEPDDSVNGMSTMVHTQSWNGKWSRGKEEEGGKRKGKMSRLGMMQRRKMSGGESKRSTMSGKEGKSGSGNKICLERASGMSLGERKLQEEMQVQPSKFRVRNRMEFPLAIVSAKGSASRASLNSRNSSVSEISGDSSLVNYDECLSPKHGIFLTEVEMRSTPMSLSLREAFDEFDQLENEHERRENLVSVAPERSMQLERINDIMAMLNEADCDSLKIKQELNDMREYVQSLRNDPEKSIKNEEELKIVELNAYLRELNVKKDDEGDHFVSFPQNYDAMVNQMQEESRENPDAIITIPISMNFLNEEPELKEKIQQLDEELIKKTKQANATSAVVKRLQISDRLSKKLNQASKIDKNLNFANFFGMNKFTPDEEGRLSALLTEESNQLGKGFLLPVEESQRLNEIDQKLQIIALITNRSPDDVALKQKTLEHADYLFQARVERERADKLKNIEAQLLNLQDRRVCPENQVH